MISVLLMSCLLNLWSIKNTNLDFFFFIDRPRNAKKRYLKQLPSVSNALTYSFMRPSFMWSEDEDLILFKSTNDSCTLFRSLGLRTDLCGQSVSTQCFTQVLLSHKHRKQRYLMYPHCRPRRKHIILRSTQMIQLC